MNRNHHVLIILVMMGVVAWGPLAFGIDHDPIMPNEHPSPPSTSSENGPAVFDGISYLLGILTVMLLNGIRSLEGWTRRNKLYR